MKNKNLLMIICMVLLVSTVSAITWRHDGTDMMRLDDYGNLNVVGNMTSSYFFGSGAYLTDLDLGEINLSSSLIPAIDDSFDLGNSSNRWKDLYLAGQVYSNGTGDNWFLGNVGIGTDDPQNALNVIGAGNFTGGLYVNGTTEFNGGWQDDGVSVIDGSIYAQTLYAYNISSLVVAHLNINGSLNPSMNNTFDVGNSSSGWWNDGYFGGDMHVGGTVYGGAFVGDGSGLTGISGEINSTAWNRTSGLTFLANSGDNVDLTSMWINNTSGNIGIGITNPSSDLEVNNSVAIRGTDSSAPQLFLDGVNGDMYFGLSSAASSLYQLWGYSGTSFRIATGNSESFRINSVGDVGIGTTSPSTKLEVADTGAVYMTLNSDTDGNGEDNDAMLRFEIDDSTQKAVIGYDQGNDVATFSYGGDTNNHLNIDSAGKIGIGTTTPQNELNVVGDGNFTGDLYANGQLVGSGTLNSTSWNRSGQSVYLANENDRVGIGDSSPNYKLDVSGGDVNIDFEKYYRINGNPVMTQQSSRMQFGWLSTHNTYLEADQTNLDFITNDTQKMRIDADGNVGVGTSSPTETLHVNGSAIFNGTINMDSNKITSLANGTTVTDAVTLGQLQSVNNTVSGDYVPYVGSDQAVVLGGYDFSVNSSDLYVDVSEGKVGIGTGSPENELNVIGTVNATTGVTIPLGQSYQIGGTDFVKYWETNRSTTVGIGSGSDTYSSTSMGYSAGNSNEGERTTHVGYYAGSENTGDRVSTFGYYAGRENEGNYLTSVGYNAGYNNSGIGSSILGYQAGYQNKGSFQTAMGYEAGYLNTGGYQTAVGYRTGYRNSAERQVAFGNYAGYLNSGSYQTALGYRAGYNNSGSKMVGIGYEAGDNNTGHNVVAIGYGAGEDNTESNKFIVKHSGASSDNLLYGDFDTGQVNASGDFCAGGVCLTELNTSLSGDYVPYTGATQSVDLGDKNLTIGTTDFFVNNENGRVGIGTDDPDAQLHLYKGSNVEMRIEGSAGAYAITRYKNSNNEAFFGINNNAGTGLMTTGGISDATTITASNSNAIQFATNGNARMSILGNGNVGIGITAPINALQIDDENAMPATSSLGDIAGSGSFRISPTGSGITMDMGVSGGTAMSWIQSRSISNYATNYGLLLNPNGGNVGIGTTSPSKTLEVQGEINVSNSEIKMYMEGGAFVIEG
jgi:hypothetical protein